MSECEFTSDFSRHRGEIEEWMNDECMGMDESCDMAGDTIQDLDYVANPSQETIKYYPDELQAGMEKLTDVRLIQCNGKLVGFAKFRPHYPEDDKKVIYFDELFIHPDNRGKGYAKWAIKEVFYETDADLIVGNSLDQSFSFWEEVGASLSDFVILGKRGIRLWRGDVRI